MSIDPETERALNDLLFACEKRNAHLDRNLDVAHRIAQAANDLKRLNDEAIANVIETLQRAGAWPRPIEQGPRQNGLAPPPLPSEVNAGVAFPYLYGMEAAE